ncbi:conserved hypothetical protein [Talaromyces stipitatus ATCC 10500]|uniref:Methyltransferase FkbM domain-containing protein n=1 Tax=Talaromyces stipitatus (strain ATCC 10500 / CBS 375.48 / QM 6759 / NRRL 1006) TaxID=441959 RepID=B8MJG6_TALSN|nr:uncharacterized protein TSTA_046200 [Talaromyces stipitatus ATCC 10500]EED15166.1 conserved hypothetical protein [Talaromyces stipitatus ATCC 10500]
MATEELVSLTKTLSCYAPNAKEAQFMYKEIFEDHCYEIPNLLPEPSFSSTESPSSEPETRSPFIIDAGANIGLFTLYMKQKYRSSKILAFEPAPQLYELLCRNLALNNIPLAGGAADNNAKLTIYPTLPSNSTLKPKEKIHLHAEATKIYGQKLADHWFGGSYEVDVKLQRLSEFLNNNSHVRSANTIDLLKIDVEGAELDVLRGLDDHHWALVRNIVLETMEKSCIRGEIEQLLKEKGFQITVEGVPWAPEKFYTIKACREAFI